MSEKLGIGKLAGQGADVDGTKGLFCAPPRGSHEPNVFARAGFAAQKDGAFDAGEPHRFAHHAPHGKRGADHAGERAGTVVVIERAVLGRRTAGQHDPSDDERRTGTQVGSLHASTSDVDSVFRAEVFDFDPTALDSDGAVTAAYRAIEDAQVGLGIGSDDDFLAVGNRSGQG